MCTRAMICPTVVHPTQCAVRHVCTTQIVPHVHPVHTTTINHQMIQNEHYFPQTQSYQTQVSSRDIACQNRGRRLW